MRASFLPALPLLLLPLLPLLLLLLPRRCSPQNAAVEALVAQRNEAFQQFQPATQETGDRKQETGDRR